MSCALLPYHAWLSTRAFSGRACAGQVHSHTLRTCMQASFLIRGSIDVDVVQLLHGILDFMYGQDFQQSVDHPGMVANPARGQLNRENYLFPCPHLHLRIWSRQTGSAVQSRVSPVILDTQAESDWLVLTHGIPPAFRDGIYLFIIPPTTIGSVPSLYQVTELRIDGVYCQDSASTGPVVLKVFCNAFSGFTMDHFLCASRDEADICDTDRLLVLYRRRPE